MLRELDNANSTNIHAGIFKKASHAAPSTHVRYKRGGLPLLANNRSSGEHNLGGRQLFGRVTPVHDNYLSQPVLLDF